jgi:cytoskeleton protein RodZ
MVQLTPLAEVTSLAAAGLALQQAREARGLSRHDIAGCLCLGVEQLEALEAGNRANLPEAVFIRAMVRRVAGKVGLNASELVHGLSDLDREQPKHQAILRSAVPARPSPKYPQRLRHNPADQDSPFCSVAQP